jgi:type IV pilus assembly protein PilB
MTLTKDTHPKKTERFGERLIRKGYITPKQFEVALHEQKRIKEPIGQILISLGMIDEEMVARAQAEEMSVPFVCIEEMFFDPGLIDVVEERFAREHVFVPLKSENENLVTVAMGDPSNIYSIDKIQSFFGKNINILAATRKDVFDAIGNAFKNRDEGGDDSADDEAGIRNETQAVEAVDSIIDTALSRRATDIHIEPEEKVLRVRYRMDGILQPGATYPGSATSSILARFKIMAGMDITEKRKPQDGRFSLKKEERNVDFRFSSMPSAHGENIVVRLLDRGSVNLNLNNFGIDDETTGRIKEVSSMSHGLFLVSGPTGSGKTTTLYSIILLVDAMARKVVTVEDPIEYSLPLIRQSQVENDIGYTFAGGLRAILRQDPDVILVGEIRDPETADIAVKASMTGHLVFSSIHTNSAMATVQRLVDLGIEPYLVASTMTGAMGQRLVRVICSKCKEAREPTEVEQEWLGPEGKGAAIYQGRGCGACGGSGYAGRTIIYEFFAMDTEFSDLTVNRGSDKDFIRLAGEKNQARLVDVGRRKVLQGITTMSEVLRVCSG